jgi:hypothetical protein
MNLGIFVCVLLCLFVRRVSLPAFFCVFLYDSVSLYIDSFLGVPGISVIFSGATGISVILFGATSISIILFSATSISVILFSVQRIYSAHLHAVIFYPTQLTTLFICATVSVLLLCYCGIPSSPALNCTIVYCIGTPTLLLRNSIQSSFKLHHRLLNL